MLCIKDLDLNTLVSGVGFNSYSNPHTQKILSLLPTHKFMYGSHFSPQNDAIEYSLYGNLYNSDTCPCPYIYIHSYSKKNQTVYEKRSDLTVTYFASSSSVAGWTISLADKHCWRRILPFGCALVIFGQTETESINQYPLKRGILV